MKKILFNSLRTLLFSLCFLYAKTGISQNTPSTWQEQLEYVKNDLSKINTSALNHLKLVNYVYKGSIESEVHKFELIDSILSDHAPAVLRLSSIVVRDTVIKGDSCVIQENSLPIFEIITIRKAIEIAESIGEKDLILRLKQNLNDLIEIGFEYLELEWNYKNNRFKSICVVSNEHGGVIYESIGQNIYIENSMITVSVTR